MEIPLTNTLLGYIFGDEEEQEQAEAILDNLNKKGKK